MLGPNERIYGIREVHRPLEASPQLDIVAVHGLNGDASRTWTARERKISWLDHPDFLPKYLKTARIMVWGYNASFSSLTGDKPSKNRIHNHAHTLVANLTADRQLAGMTGKPIIFLCHSLGGIVVKRALAYSQTRTGSRVTHELDIFVSTYGIMFFGTPHKGSAKAGLLASLKRIASFTLPKPIKVSQSELVLALKEESETLQNITDFFVPMMGNFRIYFFWEQEKTDLKILGRDFIVPTDSAAPLYDNTERAGIAADHSGLVKFEDPASPGFQLVVGALMRYCEDAPDAVEQRHCLSEHNLSTERVRELLETLRQIPPTARSQFNR